MNRQNKQVVVETLSNDFVQSKGSFVIGVQGMTVGQMQSLRKDLRQQGGHMVVAKNTLIKIAVKDIPGAQDLAPFCNQQIAVVFAQEELPGIAKAIYTVAKENENLKIVAGCFDGAVVDEGKVKYLATLPPREHLLAQVCGTIAAPLTSHVRLLNQVIAQFVNVLRQASEKQA